MTSSSQDKPSAETVAGEAAPVNQPQPAAKSSDGWRPPPRGRLKNIFLIAVGVVALCLVLYAWKLPPFHSAVVSTDNAYCAV